MKVLRAFSDGVLTGLLFIGTCLAALILLAATFAIPVGIAAVLFACAYWLVMR